jgi:hypothetical protein
MSERVENMRDAIGQTARKLQDSGMNSRQAEQTARQAAVNVDRKIERGDLFDPRKK